MDSRWGEPKTRTVEYYDPKLPARAAMTMTGLEYLQAIGAGEIPAPPITALMNMTLDSVEHGKAVFGLVPDDSLYNPIGAVHGGAICTVLDSVAGCAVHSTLDAGWGYTSVEIKVNYIRGTTSDSGRLTATGVVRKGGSRIAFAEAEMVDEKGRLIATASSTLLVFELRA